MHESYAIVVGLLVFGNGYGCSGYGIIRILHLNATSIIQTNKPAILINTMILYTVIEKEREWMKLFVWAGNEMMEHWKAKESTPMIYSDVDVNYGYLICWCHIAIHIHICMCVSPVAQRNIKKNRRFTTNINNSNSSSSGAINQINRPYNNWWHPVFAFKLDFIGSHTNPNKWMEIIKNT